MNGTTLLADWLRGPLRDARPYLLAILVAHIVALLAFWACPARAYSSSPDDTVTISFSNVVWFSLYGGYPSQSSRGMSFGFVNLNQSVSNVDGSFTGTNFIPYVGTNVDTNFVLGWSNYLENTESGPQWTRELVSNRIVDDVTAAWLVYESGVISNAPTYSGGGVENPLLAWQSVASGLSTGDCVVVVHLMPMVYPTNAGCSLVLTGSYPKATAWMWITNVGAPSWSSVADVPTNVSGLPVGAVEYGMDAYTVVSTVQTGGYWVTNYVPGYGWVVLPVDVTYGQVTNAFVDGALVGTNFVPLWGDCDYGFIVSNFWNLPGDGQFHFSSLRLQVLWQTLDSVNVAIDPYFYFSPGDFAVMGILRGGFTNNDYSPSPLVLYSLRPNFDPVYTSPPF